MHEAYHIEAAVYNPSVKIGELQVKIGSPSGTNICYNVRRAVDTFVKDAEQFDDLTMLCLEYKGKKERD